MAKKVSQPAWAKVKPEVRKGTELRLPSQDRPDVVHPVKEVNPEPRQADSLCGRYQSTTDHGYKIIIRRDKTYYMINERSQREFEIDEGFIRRLLSFGFLIQADDQDQENRQ